MIRSDYYENTYFRDELRKLIDSNCKKLREEFR